MSASTKLSTAVKALCYLAQNPGQIHNSSDIARAIVVNASKIRTLLSKLAQQGIVQTVKGKEGGFQLLKQVEKIHLQEIYCALEDQRAFHLDVQNGGIGKDSFPKRVNQYFDSLFYEIQLDIENKMKDITIADIIHQTQ